MVWNFQNSVTHVTKYESPICFEPDKEICFGYALYDYAYDEWEKWKMEKCERKNKTKKLVGNVNVI